MNKQILIVTSIIMAVLLVSCNDDEPNGPVPIKVKLDDTSSSTRGAQITSDNIPTFGAKKYKLFAYSNTTGTSTGINARYGTLSDGYDVTTTTAYTIPYYWPLTYGLDFYAVYPASLPNLAVSTAVASDKSSLTLGYTIAGQMKEQQDVLFSYAQRTNAQKNLDVPIHFQHALTRVTFQGTVTNNDPNFTDIKITGITIKGAHTKIDLNYKSYQTSGSGTNLTITSTTEPTINTSTSGNVVATGLTTNNTITTNAQAAGTYIGYDAPTGTGITGGDSFFMVPMTSTAGVTLEVTVSWKDAAGVKGSKTYKDIKLPQTYTKWERGKHVNYTLNFDARKETTAIVVAKVTVQPWPTPINGGSVTINEVNP